MVRYSFVWIAAVLAACRAACGAEPSFDLPRPIAAADTVFIEEMTWMEVRDALADGKTTVIIPTGGVEQAGPYLATGKHNLILRATTEAIARRLGDALVAPIVPFVPQGNIDPPTYHMRYPGTVSVSEETFQRLLVDIAASMRTHGFTDIVLLGDSGPNEKGMQAVAKELNKRWADEKTRVHHIPEFNNFRQVRQWLADKGIQQTPEGIHDDFSTTAQVMTVDPRAVRMKERIAADKFRINGVELAPAEETIAWGRKIVAYRTGIAVEAIQEARKRE